MSVLIDTSLLVEYLRGDVRAAHAVEAHAHRAISVLTWLATMDMAPVPRREATMAFLRSFERLSINEAIVDEALRLKTAQPDLDIGCAVNWATARMNRLLFVTSQPAGLPLDDAGVSLAYSPTLQR